MPPPLSHAHPVLESLDGEHLHRVKEWRSHILKNEDDRQTYMRSADRVKPYLDPGLVRDSSTYASFLMRLNSAGILTWRVGIKSWLGCFFLYQRNQGSCGSFWTRGM